MNGSIPVDGPVEVVVFAALSVAVVLATWRLLRGPSLPDRVIALELLALLGLAFVVLYSIAAESPLLIDLALVIALISFLSTVAFAYYLEKGTLPREEEG